MPKNPETKRVELHILPDYIEQFETLASKIYRRSKKEEIKKI